MLKGKIQDYNQHKQWLKDFFNGEFIHPNFLNVDSDTGVGFIFFYKIHPGIYFMVFNIEAKIDIPFTVDYSSSLYFDYIASFFNSEIIFEGGVTKKLNQMVFIPVQKIQL
ncbi:hypothetical protein EI427_25165 [Flammeovirga pectinis]|uniref:Uncharacterized protein n=1 Tax=Flammeovirga pectinis TaxID=2494373 RepID=A0A3Q9FVH8_9BACT|nr:hypothetical protein [Flammeovirga pectinis]AZQ65506.1 hypothetical protein EI427_25165 [Flammeovirga pectinis]